MMEVQPRLYTMNYCRIQLHSQSSRVTFKLFWFQYKWLPTSFLLLYLQWLLPCSVSATLFAATAEKFIQFTATQHMEADEKNAPLTDEVARKIEKKRVMCFLKYFDKTFKGKAEMTYTILTLYAQEEANSAMAQPPSNLTVGEIVSNVQGYTSVPAEKEQQMFSPSIKKVIEEIASTVTMDEITMLPAASAKRAIVFGNDSAENEVVLSSDKSPSPTHDIVALNLGLESPVKKLKNKVSEN